MPDPARTWPEPRPWSAEAEAAGRAAFDALPVPPGSLGKLEHVAAWWCGATGRCPPPTPARPQAFLFAADHGVVAASPELSRYPRSTTATMVRRFRAGEGVIAATCRHYGVALTIVDAGVDWDAGVEGGAGGGRADVPGASEVAQAIRAGTGDFRVEPAMTRAEAEAAVQLGVSSAIAAAREGADLLCAGEMGIGNTTSAAAVLAAIAAVPGKLAVGRGSGVDDAGVRRKAEAVDAGIARHKPARDDGIGVLAAVGGLEIAAIAGLCIGGAASGVPVIVDGFASTAGALVASVLVPGCLPNVLVGHRSAENGHWAMSRYLRHEPVLDLDLSVGEGVGAVMAVDLVRLAVAILGSGRA